MQDRFMDDDVHISDDIVDALQSAAREIQVVETWLPERQGMLAALVPRLIRILAVATDRLPGASPLRRTIRQNTLRFLSYIRADLRIGAMLEMALEAPDALRDLLSGPIDQAYEPYRYNIFVLTGVFARHGIINGVIRADRLERVEKAMDRAQVLRSRGQKATEGRE